MAKFRLFLIGSQLPIEVDLPVMNVAEISEFIASSRFIQGHLSEPDHHGVCAGVLIPTCRIQLIVEAN